MTLYTSVPASYDLDLNNDSLIDLRITTKKDYPGDEKTIELLPLDNMSAVATWTYCADANAVQPYALDSGYSIKEENPNWRLIYPAWYHTYICQTETFSPGCFKEWGGKRNKLIGICI